MTTHYQSSKGPKVISDLPPPYLANALAKLQREGDPTRVAEIEAMSARLADLNAMPDDATRIAATTPNTLPANHQIGSNKPPAVTPREAHRANIEDLYAEAKGWLDGEPITTQGQADAVSRLKGMIKEAEAAAEASRKVEVKPLDDAKAEVQAFYNPLIADNKGVKGKTTLAIAACDQALTPWLLKLERERLAAAEAARLEAARIAAEAQAAAALATSIEDAEKADAMFVEAKAATREAVNLASDRARVGANTGYRATILRDNWIPILTDGTVALRHYWTHNRAALEACALQLAVADVRSGKRMIPGFTVINEQRAA